MLATQQRQTPKAAWAMLALGVAAQAADTLLISTPAFLIPMLHQQLGMPLAQAGLIAAAPTFGMVLTLVLWGALTDRFGERWVISGGLALTSIVAWIMVPIGDLVWLGIMFVLAGAAAASANSASGRLVVGWFPVQRRGLAMGIRQMCQPLGVAAAAIAVPPLAERFGIGATLLLSAALTGALAVACAVIIRDPARPSVAVAVAGNVSQAASSPTQTAVVALPKPANPYVRDRFLLRIHTVSLLLVVPQFTCSTFGLVWMTAGLGWEAGAAGAVIAVSQFIGAIGRIGVGQLSDRVGSRTRVLRWVAVAGVATMLALSATGAAHWAGAAAVALIIASTVSVADNGLAFTSVAEAAGPSWSGRALGVQNTGQFIAAAAVGPAIGALITSIGYPLAFAAVALTPLLSVPLVPKHDQHWEV